MKTKIIAALLTMTLLFSFAACGKADTGATTTAESTTIQTTLQETSVTAAGTTTEAVTTQTQTDVSASTSTATSTTAATTVAVLSAEDEARKLLLPAASSFSGPLKTSLSGIEYTYFKGLGTAGKTAGYIFTTSAKGYKSDIKTMIGIDAKGIITGVEILEINDTQGIGTKVKDAIFLNQFIGKSEKIIVSIMPADNNEIQAITGATKSSSGVTNAVNLAFDLYKTVS